MRSSAKSPDVIGPLERTQKRADCRHMGRHQESFCDHASETMSLDPAVGGPQRLIAWFRTQRSWAGWCSYIARSLGIRNKRVERCCPIIALNRSASYRTKCTVLLCLAASTPWCGQLLTWCSSPLFFLETSLNSDCRGDRAAWRHQCVSIFGAFFPIGVFGAFWSAFHFKPIGCVGRLSLTNLYNRSSLSNSALKSFMNLRYRSVFLSSNAVFVFSLLWNSVLRIWWVYLWCAWCFAELPNFVSRFYSICMHSMACNL